MDRRQNWLRRLPLIGGGTVAIALIVGLVWFVRDMLGSKNDKPARTVQVVQMIRPPPPPPEDTPPPPPPEKVDEPLPQNEPEPAPSDEPTPSEQLGLDADGSAGGDGFGLAARKGGRDLVGSGGAAFAWYTGRLKDRVAERLADDVRLRARKFVVSVKVWIEPDGKVRTIKLASSTGNRDLDSILEQVLASLPPMSESPPLEMPQPISLRIISRI